MPRKGTMHSGGERQRKVRSWPVRWRGIITRDVGLECIFADSAKMAREIFKKDYPMREIIFVGKPVQMRPVKQ